MKKILCAAFAAILACTLALPAFAAGAVPDDTGVSWPLGQALPSFGAPAGALDAIDVIEMPFDERLAVACLQGIVNRTQPRILLVDRDGDSRDSWGGELGLVYTFAPWKDLVLKYQDELKGLVIFNPDVEDTANVANTIAGINDALAVSPELAEELKAAPYDFPVLADLRGVSAITDKLSAYRWMHENCWEQCTRRTISGLYPGGHTNLRDFSTAARAAILWLDPKIPEEEAVLRLFFDDTESLECFYTGWWPDEGAGIAFASTYGVTTVPSDFYVNYTVYAGMSRQLEIPAVPAKPALEDGKIYVSLNFSDGDNIQYDQGHMKNGRLWSNARRGEIPIGWTLSPAMLDAGPQILNFYLKTASEGDVLISGPSGLGYSTAAHWPDKDFTQRYGAITNSYFERTGMNIITVWRKMTYERANWYLPSIPSLLGVTVQFEYGQRVQYTRAKKPVVWFGSDVPSSRGAMSYDNGISNFMERMCAAAEWKNNQPQLYMAQADAWATGVEDFIRLRDDLEAKYPGRFVFVRPDHLMMLLNEYHAKPFLVSLQKQAKDSAGSPAAITDGTISTGWEGSGPNAALEIDLGENVALDRYVLKNAETNYLDAGLNTKAWELYASADGEAWTKIDGVEENSQAIVYRNLRKTCARYVRLEIKDAGADGVGRIQELEIYGVPAARANNFLVRMRSFFHDLRTRIAAPYYAYLVRKGRTD